MRRMTGRLEEIAVWQSETIWLKRKKEAMRFLLLSCIRSGLLQADLSVARETNAGFVVSGQRANHMIQIVDAGGLI